MCASVMPTTLVLVTTHSCQVCLKGIDSHCVHTAYAGKHQPVNLVVTDVATLL